MASIEIRPVRTAAERLSFIKFQELIYKHDPYWVQPLVSQQKTFYDPDKNPFFEHGEADLFMAYRGRRPVGRISAIVNRLYNEYQDEQAGFFGSFEALDDSEAAAGLLQAAAERLRSRGCKIVYGPATFSANEEYGLLVEGFNSAPFVMMPYNPPYYASQIVQCGFIKARDLMAYTIDDARFPDRIYRIAERIQARQKITLRALDLQHLDSEIWIIKGLYNRVLEDIWGFVPLTDAEIEHMASDLKRIIDPSVVLFAESGDKPVGFILSIPDINQALIRLKGRLTPWGLAKYLWSSRRIDRIRVAAMGVIPEYRKRGVETLLYIETLRRSVSGRRYKRAELSFVLEDNLMMNRAARYLGARLYKKYRIYQKPLA